MGAADFTAIEIVNVTEQRASMNNDRPSDTALKVALTMVTLNHKRGWAERLPPQTASLSEQLILSAKAFGYSPGLMRASKQGWMVGFYDVFDRVMPGMFEGLGERKIFMNDQVLSALDSGASQVLVLGAGFDTLCLRLASQFPEVAFFEIDHPSTAVAKQQGVQDVGQPDNLTLIAADLAESRLTDVLVTNPAWQPDQKTVVVMEGLLYYLPSDAVLDVFAQLHELTGNQSWVAFSHVLDKRRHAWAQPLLNLIGEPWLSSATVEQLPDYVGKGWGLVRSEHPEAKGAFEAFAVVAKT
jgi:methyltransferase (TIGR00027 family)